MLCVREKDFSRYTIIPLTFEFKVLFSFYFPLHAGIGLVELLTSVGQ